MASALYDRSTSYNEAREDGGELHRQVWRPVCWMLDVYVGRECKGDDRQRDILTWCNNKWGKQHWPDANGRPTGRWRSGNAIVHGWQWFGFESREMMDEFQARWGGTDQEHDGLNVQIGR